MSRIDKKILLFSLFFVHRSHSHHLPFQHFDSFRLYKRRVKERHKEGIDRRDQAQDLARGIRQFGLSQIRSYSSEEEPDWKSDKGWEDRLDAHGDTLSLSFSFYRTGDQTLISTQMHFATIASHLSILAHGRQSTRLHYNAAGFLLALR